MSTPEEEKVLRTVQISFRCPPDLYEPLRNLAHHQRVSLQKLLEQGAQQVLAAVDVRLESTPPRELSGATPKELRFLAEVLYFLRNAPAEFIANVRGLVASMNKMARREQRDETRKAG